MENNELNYNKFIDEYCKVDIEGFNYWLASYFNCSNSILSKEINKLLCDTQLAIFKVQKKIENLKIKLKIGEC